MRQRTIRLLLPLLLMTAVPAVHAQEGISRAKQEKIQAKKEKRDAKEVKKEEKRLAKQHLKNQDPATRKRMKRNKRSADQRGIHGRREPFFNRLFGPKH